MAPEARMADKPESSLLAAAKGEGPLASPWRELLTVGLLVLAALAFRLFLMRYERMVWTDSVVYLMLAREMLAGRLSLMHGVSEPQYFVLLYSAVVAAVFPLVGDLELAGRLVSVASGSLTAVPVYLLGKALYGRRAGYYAAGLVAFLPALAGYSVVILTEALYTLLLMAGIALGWWALQRRRRGPLFWAGVALGLSYAARIVGLANSGMMALLVLWHGLFVRRLKSGALAANLVVLLVGASLLVVPSLLYWRVAFGNWSPWGSVVGAVEVDYLDPQAPMGESRARLTPDARQFQYQVDTRPRQGGNFAERLVRSVLEHRGLWARRVVEGLYDSYRRFVPQLLPPAMLLLIALGLFRRRWSAGDVYLGAWVVGPALIPILMTRADARYLVPLLPIAAIWAGRGVEQMGVWLAANLPARGGGLSRAARLYAPWLVLIVVIGSLVPDALRQAELNRSEAPYEQRVAGEWIRQNLLPNPVIMHRKPEVAFYANGRFLLLPYDDYPKVINFARHAGANYLIVDRRFVAPRRPQLAFLLDETKAPPEDLQLVYKWEADPKYTVMVYKVLPGRRGASSP